MKKANLSKRLANFVRQKRGEQSLRAFSEKYGLSASSVARIESEEQNVTLRTIEDLCNRFKCDFKDLFPEQ